MAETATQPTLEEDGLEVCEITAAVMEKAAQDYQIKEAEAREVEAKIPSVVESLVVSGLIEPEDKEAAVKELRKPTQVLELLKLAAENVQQLRNGSTGLGATQVDKNGSPAREKSASSNGKIDHRAEFERRRDEESDRILGLR